MWTYYRGYTHSAAHAGAAAALSAFGLFTFVDPLFAIVGVVAYVCPPVVLYYLDGGPGVDGVDGDSHGDGDSDGEDGDSDTDGSDGDFDGDDGDTDSDGS
ncbi:hypothetical protein EA472_18390 [Natrarchaeobius oligotrophus]|uniref:Uncharacterized protein n=1 Tax=Natrarchaeobius chitinivorans TaxID=1679083 RepID=A0A3N6M7H4_NATCH|nr:hypothetical protein EA472_18390 [Natrarchaeobius chitinivorans]